jgi:hypothetical protein
MRGLRERLSMVGCPLYVIFFVLALLLAGCGGGSGGGSSSGTSGGGGGTGGTDGVLNLSWVAPTTNADGTELTDLAGYKVYYGTSTGNYGTTPTDAGNVTTYTLTGLTKGTTYYIAVTAYDTSDNESDKSTEGSGAAD